MHLSMQGHFENQGIFSVQGPFHHKRNSNTSVISLLDIFIINAPIQQEYFQYKVNFIAQVIYQQGHSHSQETYSPHWHFHYNGIFTTSPFSLKGNFTTRAFSLQRHFYHEKNLTMRAISLLEIFIPKAFAREGLPQYVGIFITGAFFQYMGISTTRVFSPPKQLYHIGNLYTRAFSRQG